MLRARCAIARAAATCANILSLRPPRSALHAASLTGALFLQL
jgi:hypothetical protein